MMKFGFLLLLATVPSLDDCNPTTEQCNKAMVMIRAEEIRCGNEVSTVAEKRTNAQCQRAVEWHDTWISKCRR
jgi:hypothetical protein